MNSTAWLRGLAVAACVAGCGLTVQSLYTAPEAARHLKQKVADLRSLQALAAAQARQFEQLPSKTPPPLGELVNTTVPGAHYNQRLRESRLAKAGWSVRSVEVSFDDLRLADLATFLERAENKRPPWHLVECSFTASDPTPGRGRASLVLEGLEKTGGG